MGFSSDPEKKSGGGLLGGCVSSLIRRKQVDSEHTSSGRPHQLAKELSFFHLIAIGTAPPPLSKYFVFSLLNFGCGECF